MFIRFFTFLTATIFLFFIAGCKKVAPIGKLDEGQVAVTFDDNSIENWKQHLGLLDSLHIKATFYISGYHKFSAANKAVLRDMARRGHEIGYHTATHPDLQKEVLKKGMAQTEAEEITKNLRQMRADGFAVSNFAYPFGSHNTQLDNCLLRTFKSVRALSNHTNYYKSLVSDYGDWQILFGANVDNNSRLTNDKIISLLDDAHDRNDCLVLVAHQIENKVARLQISADRLRLLASEVARRNMKFITVNDLTR